MLKVWAFNEGTQVRSNSCFVKEIRCFDPFSLACLRPNDAEGEKNADFWGKLCACQSGSWHVKKHDFIWENGEKGVFICPMKPLKIAILACVVAKLDVWRLQTSRLTFDFYLFWMGKVGVSEKSLHYFASKLKPRFVNNFHNKSRRTCNPPWPTEKCRSLQGSFTFAITGKCVEKCRRLYEPLESLAK